MSAPHGCYAIVTPGFEAVVARELGALGANNVVIGPGGVEFVADDSLVLAANVHLRAASRVVVRAATFGARSFAELERHAKRVPWDAYVRPGGAAAFRVTCRKSRLYHSDAVAERLERALMATVPQVRAGRVRAGAETDDSMGAEEDAPPQLFIVRMANDVCTISADASGPLLHRRGYRLATAKAPLRETIAAGCLLALGYDGTQPLVDPMCGSGTIPIEAALIARQMAPGASRSFACERWPGFAASRAAGAAGQPTGAPRLGAGLADTPRALRHLAPSSAPIMGSDRDAGAVAAARANATRAGVADGVAFATCALSAVEPPPGPGLLLINPPYGARIGEAKALRNLYAQIGNVARRRFPAWRVALISASRQLEGHTGLPFDEVLRFSNGGIRVRLVAATVN